MRFWLGDQCSLEPDLLALELIVLSECDLGINFIGLFLSWELATRGAAERGVVGRGTRSWVPFCSIFASSLAAEVVCGLLATTPELFDLYPLGAGACWG